MQLIGHRGARQEAPENTLGGFQYLKDLGVRAVEFDVRQLTSGELVIMHDDNFLRTSGVNQHIYDGDFSSFSAYDLAQHYPDWQQHEPLPLLAQAMHIFSDFNHIEVEVKAVDNTDVAEKLVTALQAELQPFQQQVTITSFDIKILQALQNQQSAFKRGLLVELPFGAHAISMAKQFGCQRIGWSDKLANQELIQLSKEADLAVSVWTVNDLARAKELAGFGIDGLITDIPTQMKMIFPLN